MFRTNPTGGGSAAVVVAVMLAVGLAGCPRAASVPRDAPWPSETRASLRVLVIGDTGLPGRDIEAVRAAVIKEKKDLVVLTGDLVYPVAPECPTGRLHPDARAVLDQRVGSVLKGLGAPVALALGNHDVGIEGRSPERLACLLEYAGESPDLFMPARHYAMDLGVAVLAVVDSNHLDDEQVPTVRDAWKEAGGWRVMAAHHVIKTYGDKVDEDQVRPWLARHGLKPEVYLNGHAHILQLGDYDGIVAVTSGSTADPRPTEHCPPDCGEGQVFGQGGPGYAVLDFTADQVVISFHDPTGKQLFTRTTRRGSTPAPAPAPAPAGVAK